MKKLRIATVGVGPNFESRSSRHIETILKMHDMYELCAFCAHDPKRLKEAGETFGVKALYTDLPEMLKQEKPDVAFRLTPKDGIVPICMQIAEAGVHLLNEIPIASTLAQADAIIDACRRNNVKMEIAENVWVWPEELLKAKISKAGLLGKIIHARLQYPCGTYHGLSTLRKIIGSDPVRALGIDGEVQVEPRLLYSGKMETSTKWEAGVFEFPGSPDSGGNINVLYEMPHKGRSRPLFWEIEGTRGHINGETLVLYENEEEIEYPIQYQFTKVDGEQVIEKLYVDTNPRIEWQNPFMQYRIGSADGPAMYGISGKDEIARAYILASMHKAVTENTEPAYGPANARMDLEAWIAVRESARQNHQWIDLPIEQETSIERAIREEFINRYGHDPVTDWPKLLTTTFPRGGVLWDVLGWL
jgi:predicted dehydrogenase